MYKSASQKQQFLDRSGSFATHGSASTGGLLGEGSAEQMTPLQRREATVARVHQLVEEIKHLNAQLSKKLPYKVAAELKQKRIAIGLEHQALSQELRKINAEVKHVNTLPDLGEFIIAICRKRFTRPAWDLIMKEAMEQFAAAGGKSEDVQ